MTPPILPLDMLLALALLAGGGDDDIPQPEQFISLRPTLQALAIHYEILGRSERHYWLNRAEEFPCDLRTMRRRWQQYQYLPRVADAMMFPTHSNLQAGLEHNRAFRTVLVERKASLPRLSFQIDEMILETDLLYSMWDAAADACNPHYNITTRRDALERLREALGADDYYAGRLPPSVPVWRFKRIN